MSRFDPTHCLQLNGSSTDEILPIGDPVETVKRAPSRLDGSTTFALSLWKLPPGMRLWDELPGAWPYEFLQAIGSREAMIIEISREEASGELHLYRLDHRPDSSHAEVVQLDVRGRIERVRASQLFDSKEAAEVFADYYRNASVSSCYTLDQLQ